MDTLDRQGANVYLCKSLIELVSGCSHLGPLADASVKLEHW
jgi:hypothetical protein